MHEAPAHGRDQTMPQGFANTVWTPDDNAKPPPNTPTLLILIVGRSREINSLVGLAGFGPSSSLSAAVRYTSRILGGRAFRCQRSSMFSS